MIYIEKQSIKIQLKTFLKAYILEDGSEEAASIVNFFFMNKNIIYFVF